MCVCPILLRSITLLLEKKTTTKPTVSSFEKRNEIKIEMRERNRKKAV